MRKLRKVRPGTLLDITSKRQCEFCRLIKDVRTSENRQWVNVERSIIIDASNIHLKDVVTRGRCSTLARYEMLVHKLSYGALVPSPRMPCLQRLSNAYQPRTYPRDLTQVSQQRRNLHQPYQRINEVAALIPAGRILKIEEECGSANATYTYNSCISSVLW